MCSLVDHQRVQEAGFEPANRYGLGPHPSAFDQAGRLLRRPSLIPRVYQHRARRQTCSLGQRPRRRNHASLQNINPYTEASHNVGLPQVETDESSGNTPP